MPQASSIGLSISWERRLERRDHNCFSVTLRKTRMSLGRWLTFCQSGRWYGEGGRRDRHECLALVGPRMLVSRESSRREALLADTHPVAPSNTEIGKESRADCLVTLGKHDPPRARPAGVETIARNFDLRRRVHVAGGAGIEGVQFVIRCPAPHWNEELGQNGLFQRHLDLCFSTRFQYRGG